MQLLTTEEKDISAGRSLLRHISRLGLSLSEALRRYPLLASLRERGLLKLSSKGAGLVTLALAEDQATLPAASGRYRNASVELAERTKARQRRYGTSYAEAQRLVLDEDPALRAAYHREFRGGGAR